jgi:hypothetical protein
MGGITRPDDDGPDAREAARATGQRIGTQIGAAIGKVITVVCLWFVLYGCCLLAALAGRLAWAHATKILTVLGAL